MPENGGYAEEISTRIVEFGIGFIVCGCADPPRKRAYLYERTGHVLGTGSDDRIYD
jgi:hypothetical protein